MKEMVFSWFSPNIHTLNIRNATLLETANSMSKKCILFHKFSFEFAFLFFLIPSEFGLWCFPDPKDLSET